MTMFAMTVTVNTEDKEREEEAVVGASFGRLQDVFAQTVLKNPDATSFVFTVVRQPDNLAST